MTSSLAYSLSRNGSNLVTNLTMSTYDFEQAGGMSQDIERWYAFKEHR